MSRGRGRRRSPEQRRGVSLRFPVASRVKGQKRKDLLSPTSSHFQSSSQVQNLGCYVVSGLIISAFLPAVAHGGNYFLSLSQVVTNNVSLG